LKQCSYNYVLLKCQQDVCAVFFSQGAFSLRPVLQINEEDNVRLLLENVPEVDHHADDDDGSDDELLRPNMEEAIRSAQQVG
jgi:hypothetical protein